MTVASARPRRALLAFVATVALFQGAAASADVLSPKVSTTISLQTLLDAYTQTASLAAVASSLSARAEAQASADGRRRLGPTDLALRAERGNESTRDAPRRGTIEALVKQKFAVGLDQDAIVAKFKDEATADFLAAQRERRDQELVVARLYSQLLRRQAATRVIKESIDDLAKIMRDADQAARTGTLAAFLATRWRLMFQGMQADLAASRSAFASEADLIGRMANIKIPTDPFSASLKPIPDALQKTEFVDDKNLVLQENLARQRSLASSATAASQLGDLEAGVGVQRDFTDKATSLIVELSVPLGSSGAASSTVRSIAGQQAALKATSDVQLARAREQFLLLGSNCRRQNEIVSLGSARVTDLERLYNKALKSFARGQSDASEVVETARELYDLRLKLVDSRQERDDAAVTLYLFAKGNAP